jgi:hypothetical protein
VLRFDSRSCNSHGTKSFAVKLPDWKALELGPAEMAEEQSQPDRENREDLPHEETGFRAPDFVPLCASFVPWSFWQGVVIGAGIRVTHCQSGVFSWTHWECFGTNEKARRSGPSH